MSLQLLFVSILLVLIFVGFIAWGQFDSPCPDKDAGLICSLMAIVPISALVIAYFIA